MSAGLHSVAGIGRGGRLRLAVFGHLRGVGRIRLAARAELRARDVVLGRAAVVARFRAIMDAAPVIIWVSGPDRSCIWFNRPWLEFTGRSMERELGTGWAQGVHPDDLDRFLKTYIEHFDARRPFRMQYRLRR